MTAKELLDEYIEKDFSIMSNPAMGKMIKIPYNTMIHLMEHYEAIQKHDNGTNEV